MSGGVKRRTLYVAIVPLLLMTIPIVYSIATYATGHFSDKPGPLLEISRENSDKCVRSTEYMRFHHWELLLQVREDVIRHGNREGPLLSDCRGCHPNREEFCDRCHSIANVMLDCFHCHYYPERPDDPGAMDHAELLPEAAISGPVNEHRPQGGEGTDG